MHDRPRVFIAAPLFNPPQIEIISKIEWLLERAGFRYYSARQHSGSDKMTAEQRKRYDAWTPIYLSNERGLDACRVQICVLEYAQTGDTRIAIEKAITDSITGIKGWGCPNPVELPDAGTVWEAGYMRAQGKLVIGFHSLKRAEHLNLMLSHGTDGLLTGFDALEKFLSPPEEPDMMNTSIPERVFNRAHNADHERGIQLMRDARLFNWSVCQTWDRRVE